MQFYKKSRNYSYLRPQYDLYKYITLFNIIYVCILFIFQNGLSKR